jgi:hypothetical protein
VASGARWTALRWILLIASILGAGLTDRVAASAQPTERERTFLRLVFNGDEAKAVEYAQIANINVNSIAGEPLSTWFYRDGRSQSGRYELRNVAVQKIVFERFKQNPNPHVGPENSNLSLFCSYAPFQESIQILSMGTPAQINALHEHQDNQRRPHIEAMGVGFESLVRYGLKDKALITNLFMGCFFRNAAPLNAFVYDTVLSKMVHAGANINAESAGGERPIQFAVKMGNDAIVERLIGDGAQADYLVRQNGFDKPASNEKCSPRRDRSLYGIVFEWAKPRNADALVAMVRALSLGGLSPMTKYGYIERGNDGSQRCAYTSFYDAVIDTGNIELAKRVKEAASSQRPPPRQAGPASATVRPTPVAPAAVTQIGAWRIANDNGRLVAVANADNKTSNGFGALRLECVAGKLEYAPIALKLTGPVTSLWLSVAGDAKEMKLVNQRASGASATTLSNEFAAIEQESLQGTTKDWGIEFSVQSANHVGDNVVMTGFSEMRAYMRAHCKS